MWTTIEYFFKFFFSVIELHERNQPTKLYLGNINITCFIKVLRNSPPRRSQKGPKNEKWTQKQKRNRMGGVSKGGQITVLFQLGHYLRSYEGWGRRY